MLANFKVCGYLRKFSSRNFGVWHPRWHKRASTKTRIFRQFVKVFSLESQVSVLYGKLIHQAKPLDDWSSSGNAGNIEMLNTGTQDCFSGH